MASDKYWADLINDIEKMSDQEFLDLLSSVGELEEGPIISDEIGVTYKMEETSYVPYLLVKKAFSDFIPGSFDNESEITIRVREDCLITNHFCGTSYSEAA